MSPEKFKCKIPHRKVTGNTLEKQSCDNLLERSLCYMERMQDLGEMESKMTEVGMGDSVKAKKVGEQFWAVAHNLETLAPVMERKNCPPISSKRIIEKLQEEFPSHRFKRWRNTIRIPRTFTQEETKKLNEKIGNWSYSNYNVHYNERLDRTWLSPVKGVRDD